MKDIMSTRMGRRQFIAAGAAFAAMTGLAGTRALAAGEAASSAADAKGSAAPSAGADAAAEEESAYAPAATEYPLTITMYDGDGNEFQQTYEAAPETVIALTDSMAEILCRLGVSEKVVGTVDPEADMPAEIADAYDAIPKLGDKKTLSRETIVGMGPDAVMGRAASFTKDGQTDPATYNGLGITLYSQIASTAAGFPTLQGIISDVKNAAAIFDVQDAASDLVNDLQNRLAQIDAEVAEKKGDVKQKVLIMGNLKEGTFGQFGSAQKGVTLQSKLIESMGAEMVNGSGSGLTYENLVQMNPDVIVYLLAKRNAATDATALDTLYAEPTIQSVPAIANRRVIEIPYAELMDCSPRVFDSAEKILAALYPSK